MEPIENGLEVERQKQLEFFNLAERFRNATNPQEVKLLGDQISRVVFGGYTAKIPTVQSTVSLASERNPTSLKTAKCPGN